jgi:hypothetical protein
VVIINFSRHFLYLTSVTLVLAGAAVLMEVSDGWARVAPGAGVLLFFSLVGALHATTLMLASNEPRTLPKKLSFVASTGIASIAAPFLGIALNNIPYLEYLSLLAASAFGSVAYWFLIRMFLIHRLGIRSLKLAIAFCVGASLASALLGVLLANRSNYVTVIAGLLPTVCWWYAFSFSLWVSLRNDPIANNRLDQSRAAASVP